MEVVGWETRSQLTCGECLGRCRKKAIIPPCDWKCDFPGLLPENGPAYELLRKLGGALFDGWGGVNLANARELAAALGHPWDQEMAEKILAGAAAIQANNK